MDDLRLSIMTKSCPETSYGLWLRGAGDFLNKLGEIFGDSLIDYKILNGYKVQYILSGVSEIQFTAFLLTNEMDQYHLIIESISYTKDQGHHAPGS